MLVSGDRNIIGQYVNGKAAATIGWCTAGIMSIAGSIGAFTTLTGTGS